jgi:hypothetical protein
MVSPFAPRICAIIELLQTDRQTLAKTANIHLRLYVTLLKDAQSVRLSG